MGRVPLSQSVKARHIRFLGHCLQHPQEDHISKYTLYHPKHGKPSPGGCKIVFHKYAAKLINPENPPPFPSSSRNSLVYDRKAWKHMEVNCWHHTGRNTHECFSRVEFHDSRVLNLCTCSCQELLTSTCICITSKKRLHYKLIH